MDCLTERGRIFIGRAREIVATVAERFDVTAAMTPDDRESAIDAVFARRGILVAAAEVKAREMTFADLWAFDSYLITRKKLEDGREMARRLCVPYLLFVGLWPERAIVYWRLTNARGEWRFTIESRETETRATCNGGTAVRDNAFLPLRRMNVLIASRRDEVAADVIQWSLRGIHR